MIVALLGCYAAKNVNWLPKFQGNLSVPFSRVKHTKTNVLLDP